MPALILDDTLVPWLKISKGAAHMDPVRAELQTAAAKK